MARTPQRGRVGGEVEHKAPNERCICPRQFSPKRHSARANSRLRRDFCDLGDDSSAFLIGSDAVFLPNTRRKLIVNTAISFKGRSEVQRIYLCKHLQSPMIEVIERFEVRRHCLRWVVAKRKKERFGGRRMSLRSPCAPLFDDCRLQKNQTTYSNWKPMREGLHI